MKNRDPNYPQDENNSINKEGITHRAKRHLQENDTSRHSAWRFASHLIKPVRFRQKKSNVGFNFPENETNEINK
jgi:hypothetical protein